MLTARPMLHLAGAMLTALALSVAVMLAADEQGLRAETETPPHPLPFLGVLVDVGVPDGAGASVVANPSGFVRLHVGGLTNGVGSGARLGVMLLAFPRSPFRPFLAADVGYVFGGLGDWLPQLVTDASVRTAVTGATVAFVNGQLGFEVGSHHFAVSLRLGLSYIDVTLVDRTLLLGDVARVTTGGLSLHGFIPSARLGFIFCFG